MSLIALTILNAAAAPEVCNGVDDDFDGVIDAPVAYFADDDGDGLGDPASLQWAFGCMDVPLTAVNNGDDCNADFAIGAEVVNGRDDDCNGIVDDRAPPANCFLDDDADSTFLLCDIRRSWDAARNACAGFGYELAMSSDQGELTLLASYLVSGFLWIGVYDPSSDNNWIFVDGRAAPGGPGVPWAAGQPNDTSHDCVLIGTNGLWADWWCGIEYPYACKVDCTPKTWYRDGDGDGLGDPSDFVASCDPGLGYVQNQADCDDGDATIGTPLWYSDVDDDGFGDLPVAVQCTPPPQAVALGGDCRDDDDTINPAATEVCGGGDENCNGLFDDDDSELDQSTRTRYYFDGDGDGFGTFATTTFACEPPPGHVLLPGDCDDDNDAVNPGALEICGNNVDDNCDTVTDEPTIWYRDADGDLHGDPDISQAACDPPDGYVLAGDDCNDGDATIHPGAEEILDDGIDQDCDGLGGDVVTDEPRVREPDAKDPRQTGAVGCGCTGSAPGAPLAWLAVALVIRRRRR